MIRRGGWRGVFAESLPLLLEGGVEGRKKCPLTLA
jgi:hypothetical protein